jgi:hypothetical protein
MLYRSGLEMAKPYEWATLAECRKTLLLAGVPNAEEGLRCEISQAILLRLPGIPCRGEGFGTEMPLRVRVVTDRTIVWGDEAWLRKPELNFAQSTILVPSFMPNTSEERDDPFRHYPATLLIWRKDLRRFWPVLTDDDPISVNLASATAPKKYRWASDARNVPAAVAAIKGGVFTSANQAARHFAGQSEPTRTPEQNQERLRKLIGDAIADDATANVTAKDRQS